MKVILFLVFSCLALHNVKGAPNRAVYKFVRCNPEGDQANCVTQQSPEMEWSPDLPTKLSASQAEYLEAEPVEDESPLWEEEEEEEEEKVEETPMMSEQVESPGIFLSGDGSGGYEGSATDVTAEDRVFVNAESETGPGWDMMGMNRFLHKAKPAEQELREDHLLKL